MLTIVLSTGSYSFDRRPARVLPDHIAGAMFDDVSHTLDCVRKVGAREFRTFACELWAQAYEAGRADAPREPLSPVAFSLPG